MSNRHLSDSYILILSKGLSFVPMPKDSGTLIDFVKRLDPSQSLNRQIATTMTKPLLRKPLKRNYKQ